MHAYLTQTFLFLFSLGLIGEVCAQATDKRPSNMRTSGQSQIERIREKIFNRFDRNGDGRIDQKEIASLAPNVRNSLSAVAGNRKSIDKAQFVRSLPKINRSTPAAKEAMLRQPAWVAEARKKSLRKSSNRGKLEIVSTGLPPDLAKLDKDKDGQLGLYEWPKKDLKRFITLDKNRDGFLTPRELGVVAKVQVNKKKAGTKPTAKQPAKKKAGSSEKKVR